MLLEDTNPYDFRSLSVARSMPAASKHDAAGARHCAKITAGRATSWLYSHKHPAQPLKVGPPTPQNMGWISPAIWLYFKGGGVLIGRVSGDAVTCLTLAPADSSTLSSKTGLLFIRNVKQVTISQIPYDIYYISILWSSRVIPEQQPRRQAWLVLGHQPRRYPGQEPHTGRRIPSTVGARKGSNKNELWTLTRGLAIAQSRHDYRALDPKVLIVDALTDANIILR